MINPKVAKYLYCIVDASEEVNLGNVGIERGEVYTIVYKDIAAIAHDCHPEPYQSDDKQVVESWVKSHQAVIDLCWERFGTILPFGFDTIIQGSEERNPLENTKKWISDDHDKLKGQIEKLRGKAEYGIQISWDPKIIINEFCKTNKEIKALEKEISTKLEGAAYMYRQKLEGLFRSELEKKANEFFKEAFDNFKVYLKDVKVEKVKKMDDGRQMLMNLSCLLEKGETKDLGDELEKIDKREGFFVKFTGPWPPYSFVSA